MRDGIRAGDVIGGRFQLVRPLGVGGMGEVWEASQLELGRPVALKLLHSDRAHDAEARARFVREARVASAVRHPHVVQIHDFGEADGQLFLAMEKLVGGTLRAIVDRELPVQPIPRTLEILGQVSDALCAAHSINLVHRDLKPENIFIERRGGRDWAIVVDFGLAFISSRGETGRLTTEGVATGTPDYMSPEQVQGRREIDPASDVYSLGCILYEMLTGDVPFTGDSMIVLTKHLFIVPERPSAVRPDLTIPSSLDDLCLRMLAKAPDDRPAIAEVHAQLTARANQSDARERGRGDEPLVGRAARMISTVSPARSATRVDVSASPVADNPADVAIWGQIDEKMVLGLGATGLVPSCVDAVAEVAGSEAVYAPHASLDDAARLVELGLPVVADVGSDEMSRLTDLLKIGVTSVVRRPVGSAELSRVLWRAIRRVRRRRSLEVPQ